MSDRTKINENDAQVLTTEQLNQVLGDYTPPALDVTVDKSGASEFEQRELQTLIKTINPDALPKYGIDGAFGKEGLDALQKILGEHAPDTEGELSIQDAIAALREIAQDKAPEVNISDKPLSEVTREQGEYIQNMLNIIDPDLMPKGHIDGIVGKGTKADLKEVLPEEMVERFDELTIDEIVQELQTQVADLPQRYVVEDCDNLTVIAREVYADDIEEYTKQLMESGEAKFSTEKAARVHAEQMAVSKIAHANDLQEGTDAHTIFPDQVLEIPESGSLKDVDGSLDWEALDGKVGPGGPCGCDGDSQSPGAPGSVKQSFASSSSISTTASLPGLPKHIQVGPQCVATLKGNVNGFLGFGGIRPLYEMEGSSGESLQQLRDKLDVKIHASGNCDSSDTTVTTADQDSDGGGKLGDKNSNVSQAQQLGSPHN